LGAGLPLPVHVLLRRAHNAKSPKDRHDTAYFAWEVSVRLAVAARPPADVTRLARGSVGQWVGALALSDAPLDAPPSASSARSDRTSVRGRRASLPPSSSRCFRRTAIA